MFLLAASGRLFGTKVALVSVGTNVIGQRLMRWLVTAAARLAYYRSFRDTVSRDAMRQMGLDTSADAVYPDVVFSLPTPQDRDDAPGRVGIGVMDYSGANDDRQEGDEIRSAYIEKMTRFALWLVDNGRPVRLFTSDTADEPIVRADPRPTCGRSAPVSTPRWSSPSRRPRWRNCCGRPRPSARWSPAAITTCCTR